MVGYIIKIIYYFLRHSNLFKERSQKELKTKKKHPHEINDSLGNHGEEETEELKIIIILNSYHKTLYDDRDDFFTSSFMHH